MNDIDWLAMGAAVLVKVYYAKRYRWLNGIVVNWTPSHIDVDVLDQGVGRVMVGPGMVKPR